MQLLKGDQFQILSVKVCGGGGGERKRLRQRQRETDRDREKEGDRQTDMGHSWGTLRTLAQDRLRWREFVAALVVYGKKDSK